MGWLNISHHMVDIQPGDGQLDPVEHHRGRLERKPWPRAPAHGRGRETGGIKADGIVGPKTTIRQQCPTFLAAGGCE
jgi:hypothetical protein